MKIINKKSEKSLIDQFISNLKKDFLRKKKQNKRFSFVLTGGKLMGQWASFCLKMILSAEIKIIGKENTKNHKATTSGTNLMFSNLLLSKPKGTVSGKTNKYKVNNIIGTEPI